jgi:hypothetical protein
VQNGHFEDFLALFMRLTEDYPSPDIFRQWAAIALVAGSLERRVWIKTPQGTYFANMYTMLVAPPGVGKNIIEVVRDLWSATREPGPGGLKAFHVAPDNMTKASLIDTLAKAKTIKILKSGPPLEYHSLLVSADEIAVLLPIYDQEYIGTLNSLWMNKADHHEVRRYGQSKDVFIPQPQLNLLAGAQPAWLGTMPEEAWGLGLTRRIIMVYSNEVQLRSLLKSQDEAKHEATREAVLERLGLMSGLFGQCSWGKGALEGLDNWFMNGQRPLPDHYRLEHYIRSRIVHVMKLAIVSAVMRSLELRIELEDVKRALGWIFEAELTMPSIFRAIVGKNDSNIMQELQIWMLAMYNRNGKRPVEGEHMRRFLLERLSHDKIETFIVSAERANIIARLAGETNLFVPKATYER